MIAYDIDIHAVAGLLKRYFRELPDPLFTEALYMNFVHALGTDIAVTNHVYYLSLRISDGPHTSNNQSSESVLVMMDAIVRVP